MWFKWEGIATKKKMSNVDIGKYLKIILQENYLNLNQEMNYGSLTALDSVVLCMLVYIARGPGFRLHFFLG